MSRYFFDTYAAIELIKDNPAFEKYMDEEIIITFLNLLEITYITLLEHGLFEAKKVFEKFKEFVVDVPEEVAFEAVKFRFANRRKSVSYCDCVGYKFAEFNNLIFLTGDDAFKGVPNVEFVK